MSHFTTVKLQCRDLNAIVKALQAIGFQPTVHEEPIHLYGIGDKLRPEVAHIVVPLAQISNSANDLGFVYNPHTKAYDMIISEFDARWGHCGRGVGLGKTFQSRFAREYAIAAIVKDGGFKIREQTLQPDGSYRLVLGVAQSAYEGLGAVSANNASVDLSNYKV